MAEAMAIELVKVVALKLADEAFKMYVRSQGIHTEVKNLGRELSRIQAMLKDASDKEIKEEAVKQWLNDLQHLAYDINDVLDDLATDAMHHELSQEPTGASTTSKVRKLIPTCCTNFSLSHRLSPKLDNLTSELRRLEEQKEGLGLIIKKDEKPKNTSRGNETSLPDASSIVGREGEIEELRNKLLRDEPSSKENFSIVPIVGMGGVGKTTLARLLFNDPQVKVHFTIKAWVCISDDFDIFKISNTILQSVTDKEFKDLNQIQMALAEQFKDKRFLLVVDDVWNENYEDWENLVRPFHSGAPGSRIIMTTRKEQLLMKLGFDHLDRLGSLSHEDALSLFALHALGVGNFDSHKTFKPHGEGIVKKCGGLPLALKTIGRMMKTKTDEEDWDDVLNSEIWDLENGNEIVPALRLSYHDLSADLKQLFAYCSLFPKDFLFIEEELVLLWMAEGFLNPSNATKSPERLGHEYFEILVSRSFFQQPPYEESLFMMHDLLVDLATFVGGEFFLSFENHMKLGKEVLSKHRHMSFIREEFVGYHKFKAVKKARSLRTFLAVCVERAIGPYNSYLSNKILVDLVPELPLLRVLSLSCFWIDDVPECIGNLKHLRYLNLSKTQIKELPENVGNLYNLQTLIIFGCWNLSKLPKSFLKLKKLRHFDIRDTPLLENLPLGIGELKSLHSLTKIIIGKDDGFKITELKGLKYLHGIISIEGLQNVQSAMHAREVNLSLQRITELELKWNEMFDGSRNSTLEKEVLNELKAHSDKLKMLMVKCYGGKEFPNWVGDPSFHRLVYVSLTDCGNCISLPPLGQLPSLKELFIQGMKEITVIDLELIGTVVAFPSLEILRFEDMPGWKVWKTNCEVLDVVFPCLREIQLVKCPSLIDISLESIPSLRVLEISDCGNSVLTSLVHATSSITKLELKSISGLTNEVWKSVIEYLGAVEKVSICRCNELRYLWESKTKASKVLVNLKELLVYGCSDLVSLEEKEDEDKFESNLLSSLRVLDVRRCDSMDHLCCPNSIEHLYISLCSSLTRVSFPTITRGEEKLKSLNIHGCKKLVGKINNTSMPMLDFLQIYGWTYLKSIIQLSTFIHLTFLLIQDCPSLESFPDLELSNLTLLKKLHIRNCPSMDASFPRGLWPPKLVTLGVGGLKKPISEWGTQNFPSSLVHLWLFDEPRVNNFHHLYELLPSNLTNLHIEKFDKLESLSKGLQHLTSLQHLLINRCPKTIDLPEALLPSLSSLGIFQSPILKEKCNGRGSHYWPLISHIPHIDLED